MKISDIECALEGILFASGEPVSISRIASIFGVDCDVISDIAQKMTDKYCFERRGIRMLRLEDSLQLCSAPEYADIIRLVLETRKPPQLSQPAMEVLAIIAYYQPVTRTYIEQIRGVDSSYTVSLLINRGLVEPCGKLDVPGKPTLFRTTPAFLRTFGLSSISELPELPEQESGAAAEQLKLKNNIESQLFNTNTGAEGAAK